MQIAQVGSSIHGKLLNPSDIDIAISYKSDRFNKFLSFLKDAWNEKVHTFRLGKYNFILLHNLTIDEYVSGMDMSVIRGYKTILTRKLVLSPEAKDSLASKVIIQLRRNQDHDLLFERYDPEQSDIERAIKYAEKAKQIGWTFLPRKDLKDKYDRIKST